MELGDLGPKTAAPLRGQAAAALRREGTRLSELSLSIYERVRPVIPTVSSLADRLIPWRFPGALQESLGMTGAQTTAVVLVCLAPFCSFPSSACPVASIPCCNMLDIGGPYFDFYINLVNCAEIHLPHHPQLCALPLPTAAPPHCVQHMRPQHHPQSRPHKARVRPGDSRDTLQSGRTRAISRTSTS